MGYLEDLCYFAVSDIKDDKDIYTSEKLVESCQNIIRPNMDEDEIRSSVIQVSLELTTDSEPKWQYVAAKLYVNRLYDHIKKVRNLDK